MRHFLRAIVVVALPLVVAACLDDEGAAGDFTPGTSGLAPGVTYGRSSPEAGAWDGAESPDGYGEADAGQVNEGSNQARPCVPLCSGAGCGAGDGCGGICMLGCNCTPACGPLDCWTSDGCGGICTWGC